MVCFSHIIFDTGINQTKLSYPINQIYENEEDDFPPPLPEDSDNEFDDRDSDNEFDDIDLDEINIFPLFPEYLQAYDEFIQRDQQDLEQTCGINDWLFMNRCDQLDNFHNAIEEGKLETIKEMFDSVPPELQKIFISFRTYFSYYGNALHAAVTQVRKQESPRNLDIIKFFLDNNIERNLKDIYDETPETCCTSNYASEFGTSAPEAAELIRNYT